MKELEQLLQALQSDPVRLQDALASALEGSRQEHSDPSPEPQTPLTQASDPAALLQALVAEAEESDRARLLRALRPFVDARTALAFDRALRLVGIARAARQTLRTLSPDRPPTKEVPRV